MPERCGACMHSDKASLDRDVASNKATGQPSLRDIAARYGLGLGVIHRHGGHLPGGLVMLDEQQQAPDLIERTERLYRLLGGVLITATKAGEHDLTIKGIREARALIELLAKLGVASSSGNAVDLHTSAEWLALRQRILTAAQRPSMTPELRAELAAAVADVEA
jgi:hypothetical protein